MNDSLRFESQSMVIKIPSLQKILIIYNPISNASNTEATARKLEMELTILNKQVEIRASEKKMKGYTRMADEIAAFDLVIVVVAMVPFANCWIH